jgi:DNA invertase Pin-like site-specific DNA recombinase
LRLTEYKRWEVIEVNGQPSIDDVSISAYGEKDRPGWNKVLAMIEAGEVDVVVAWHLDRLTRNMADLERLILLCEKHNVSVATATGDIDLTNDTGRMVARILAAVARQEVERKAARQRLAHVQRRQEGRPWAGVKMLGYSRTGEVIEEEAAAIQAAAAAVLEKDVSLAEVGRQWTEKELRSPYQAIRDDQGNVIGFKPWSPRGVRNVLTNPRLAGYITHDGVVLGKGNWEPIIDDTTATLLLSKLNAPERTNGKSKAGRRAANLLTGIARCGICEGTMRAAVKRGRETYICGDWHVSVPREDADNLVKVSLGLAVQSMLPGSVIALPAEEDSPEAIAAEVEQLRERQGKIAKSFAAGLIEEAQFDGAIAEIAERITALQDKVTHPSEDVEYKRAMLKAYEEFNTDDLAGQRSVLERLTKVTINPAGVGKRMSARSQVNVQVRQRIGQTEKWIQAYP